MLRRALPLATLALVALARADFPASAYSNLGSYSNPSYSTNGYSNLDAGSVLGFRFSSRYTGTLTGFQLALNDAIQTDADGNTVLGPSSTYHLDFYQANGTDGSTGFGKLLGSYGGVTTGQNPELTSTALSTIDASGDELGLLGGRDYWIVLSFDGAASWNQPDYLRNPSFGQAYYRSPGSNDPDVGLSSFQGFAVNMTAVPGPAGAAAFLAGLARKRRKKA